MDWLRRKGEERAQAKTARVLRTGLKSSLTLFRKAPRKDEQWGSAEGPPPLSPSAVALCSLRSAGSGTVMGDRSDSVALYSEGAWKKAQAPYC